MNKIWTYLSFLGMKSHNKSLPNRNIIIANRINFILLVLLLILNLLTLINREINNGVYTIHTKKLLILLILCLFNTFFSSRGWHNLTKISLIITPPLILVFLPVFLGEVQESDFINAPIVLIGLSFIPQLILLPKLTNKLYLFSFLFYLTQVFLLDYILIYFASQEYHIVTVTDYFHFFYKLVFGSIFIFIQFTMFYLRNINYSYENELMKANEELKMSLEELKTTQQYLVQSEKMASLGTLASGIAHEINNPLNFISGGTLILENVIKENLPEKYTELKTVIDAINTGILRASDIVKSLNQYNNSNKLAGNNCNIHEIIDDCLIILQSEIKNRIVVKKKYTDQITYINGNEGKLHQAFLNILVNAAQAINEKGEVFIQTTKKDHEIEIIISDTGIGIATDAIDKIFDPFYTTKDPGKGTGLGLSITYNIIKEHKGLIEIDSIVDKGTTVVIKLPLKVYNEE